MKNLLKKAKKHWWKIIIGGVLLATGNEMIGVPILKDVFIGTPVEEVAPAPVSTETKTDTALISPIEPKEDDE